MKVNKFTSAVEGVGSSRKKNTSAKMWLEYLSPKVHKARSYDNPFQVYTIQPPYSYHTPPMSKDRSLGAVWYNRKTNKLTSL